MCVVCVMCVMCVLCVCCVVGYVLVVVSEYIYIYIYIYFIYIIYIYICDMSSVNRYLRASLMVVIVYTRGDSPAV